MIRRQYDPVVAVIRTQIAAEIRATPVENIAGVGMQADLYHEQTRELFALVVEGASYDEAEAIVRQGRSQ